MFSPTEDVSDLRKQWPCIENTLNDKKFHSHQRALKDVHEFISEQVKGSVLDVSPEQWMVIMVKWGELRGRTRYPSGEIGPAPQSAPVFFNLFQAVLKKQFNFNLCDKHPILRKFPKMWMRTICREKMYQRKQAQFFSRDDVRSYVILCRQPQATENQTYYARMAEVVILISVMFAGCRLGELFSVTIGQVKFMTVKGKVAVTFFPGGSKTDFAGQRTTCIAFSQLADEELCPVKSFFRWLKFRGLNLKNGMIDGPFTKRVFPVYKSNRLLETSFFTKKVQNMEKKGQANLPKFNAHTGRVTITTLSLFSKDNDGRPMVTLDLLEHQNHWQRGTATVSNYLGHNSTFAEGGFHDQMAKIRSEGLEGKIDEQAVRNFALGEIDHQKVLSLFDETE